jgi:hypothetical protein
MKRLRHENIVKLYEVLTSRSKFGVAVFVFTFAFFSEFLLFWNCAKVGSCLKKLLMPPGLMKKLLEIFFVN